MTLAVRRATAGNTRVAPEGTSALVPFAELPLPEDSKRRLERVSRETSRLRELYLKTLGCQKTVHSMPCDPRADFTGNLPGKWINEFGGAIRTQCKFLAGGTFSGTTIGNGGAFRMASEGIGAWRPTMPWCGPAGRALGKRYRPAHPRSAKHSCIEPGFSSSKSRVTISVCGGASKIHWATR